MICPVCFWEDDQLQLRWPFYQGGANKPSLIEAQKNYRNLGVSEARFMDKVRPPSRDEPLDPGFRPIDISAHSFEETLVQEEPWPDDRSVLYWWRPTFWRRSKGGEQ